MTDDIYNKPDKAGLKQQLLSRLSLLQDEGIRLENEKRKVYREIGTIKQQLEELNNTRGAEVCG